jgi:hypothetical protein
MQTSAEILCDTYEELYMRKETAQFALVGSLALAAAVPAQAFTTDQSAISDVSPLVATATLNETFASVNTLAAQGWAFANTSDPGPVSSTATANWVQGSANTFGYSSQDLTPTGYIVGDVSVTDQSQTNQFTTASEWLLTPEITFGGTFSFYTRTSNGNNRAEFLDVRASTSGASTNVGTTATGFGDFTTSLLTVGSATDPTVYPGGIASNNFWTQFTVNTSSLAGSGRLAFHWFGTNAGPVPDPSATPTNFNIGIDTVSYAVPEPVTGSFATASLVLAGAGALRRSRRESRQRQASN